MNKMNKMNIITILSILLLSISPAIAKDNTGTNPINFTKDFRVYHNYLELDTKGDGSLNTTTVEFRTPFADGKWQFRVRVPFVNSDIDLTGNGVDDPFTECPSGCLVPTALELVGRVHDMRRQYVLPRRRKGCVVQAG